jgi:hypothetical protein
MKEDDEADDDLSENDDDEGEGSLSRSLTESGFLLRSKKHWRKALLRPLSLALAAYGFLVMVVCLITNTFFIASH